MKNLTLLVGLPACGKTTWRESCGANVVLSTDDIIELVAKGANKTYDQVFDTVIDNATKFFNTCLEINLHEGSDIVIDRTNLSKKSRRRFLDAARHRGYTAHAVEFARPMTSAAHDEWNRRLERPGKTIPTNVLQTMFCSLQEPTLDEGFDSITHINAFEGF